MHLNCPSHESRDLHSSILRVIARFHLQTVRRVEGIKIIGSSTASVVVLNGLLLEVMNAKLATAGHTQRQVIMH